MATEKLSSEELDRGTEPLEGDEGELEVGRHRDVGRQILLTSIADLKPTAPVTLTPDAPVSKAIELMRKKKVGAVMVVERKKTKRLVGIFTERDLVNRVLAAKSYGRLTLAKVMTKDPETLSSRDSVAYALNKMSVGRFRHIPVVSADGAPRGMISIRDIVDFVVELCPEEILNLPPEPELAIAKAVDGG